MFLVKPEHAVRPFVSEEDGTLSLHFGIEGAVQSKMRVDAPDLLVLGYTRLMMSFLLFLERPGHIGIIGLGGGSIQKHCYRHLPDTQISVAEINSEILALRNTFFIPNDDHRFNVFCEDGVEFIKRHPGQFDVLLVDAFDVAGLPPQLSGRNFYEDCYRAMARDSILVVNFCDYFPKALINQMRECFGRQVLAVDAEDSVNTIVFAGKGHLWRISEEQLNRSRMHIEQQHSINLDRMVQEFLLDRESCHKSQSSEGPEERRPEP